MTTPPLAKCLRCGDSCLWLVTLCSNCIRQIEDAQKREEAERPTTLLPRPGFPVKPDRIPKIARGTCKHCGGPTHHGDAHGMCESVAIWEKGGVPEQLTTDIKP